MTSTSSATPSLRTAESAPVDVASSASLWSRFLSAAERFADRPALSADGETLSYAELSELARSIAATLQARPEFTPTPLTAVFAYRTPTAFTGVLGSLLAGTGYVPLNRQFPVARSRTMLERADCQAIIVDAESLSQLDELIADRADALLVLLPDVEDVADLRQRWPQHTILGYNEFEPASRWRAPTVPADAIAYLLFTSGSTGIPKGVMVAQRNVAAFLDYMTARYEVTENDRLSQMFDLTFDLSVFDMFIAWGAGAWLHCPSQKALMNPSRFVKEREITVWFSVPSTAVFMKRLGSLKPDAFPSLRLSLFCGEPLPLSVAAAWADAAPNAVLENIYGPTELTIACTHHRWDADTSPSESEIGIVPIGDPYPGMSVLVVDDSLNQVAEGEDGELLMTGPQMSLGYWKDPDKTAAAFVRPPGSAETYYRTGDRVRRPPAGRPLTHLGRMDSQIKIRGHRVELGEIEASVREASGLDGVVAVPWPITEHGCESVEVFLQGIELDTSAVREKLAARLPEYMLPRRFHLVENLPLNANGKFDRKALAERLNERGRA